MRRLGGHGPAKYPTGTRLGTSEGQAGRGCWRNAGRIRKAISALSRFATPKSSSCFRAGLPIRRRGDGQVQHCNAVPGTIWLCPAGVYEDMIHLYGEVRESIHLFLPALPLAETALREISVDPARVSLRYDGGFAIP